MLAVLAPTSAWRRNSGFLQPRGFDLPGTERPGCAWWSALAGVDLVHLGTTADADEISDTAKTQPLLVAAAAAASRRTAPGASTTCRWWPGTASARLRRRAGRRAHARGGDHLRRRARPRDGRRLRARADRHECRARRRPGRGGRPRSTRRGLYPANRNGAGQIVAAGSLARAGEVHHRSAGPGQGDRPAGRRSVPHAVHGPGREGPGQRSRAASPPATPAPDPALQCRTVPVSTTARRCSLAWSRRSTAPVRWDLCMHTLADLGVTGVDRAATGRHAGRTGQAASSRAPRSSR